MRRFALLVALFALCFAVVSDAQNGTPHGIASMWNAPVPVGGSGAIQGYYLFRCVGTATTCTLTTGTWSSVGGLLPANVLTGANCTGFTNCYLDPASGLTVNTSYMYAVATVDSNGDESSWDLDTTPAVVGATFPSNPSSPTGAKSVVQ